MNVRFTYFFATIACFTALPCVVGVLDTTPSATETWVTLAVAGGLAALLLLLESRRDVYTFAQYAIVMLMFPATLAIAVLSVTGSDALRFRAGAGIALCVFGMGLAVARIWREHRVKDEVPNLLLQRFGKDAIFEAGGVQWSVLRGPPDVVDGSWVRIFFQGCVDAERTVTVTLESVGGLLQRGGGLLTPPLEPIQLAPGEVGALLVPVRAGPRPYREAFLYVSARVRGPAGRRVRKFRGRAASGRTSLAFQVFALLGGHIVWGGGVRFPFTNRNELAGAAEASDRPTWHSISQLDSAEAAPHELPAGW